MNDVNAAIWHWKELLKRGGMKKGRRRQRIIKVNSLKKETVELTNQRSVGGKKASEKGAWGTTGLLVRRGKTPESSEQNASKNDKL